MDQSTEALQVPFLNSRFYNVEVTIKNGIEVLVNTDQTKAVFPEKVGDDDTIVEIPEWNVQIAAGISHVPGDDRRR